MHFGVGAFVVAATAITVGALVQGSVGFGLNLLAAPFVAIVVPKALPAALVLVALPLAVTLLIREHPHLHRSALPWMVCGAVPGTALGLLIVGHVSGVDLAIVVGAITLIGVALSVVSPPIKVNTLTSIAAGFTSQIFGTASSVGGPPVALLFQHHPGPAARSTLSGFFASSALMSIVGYLITGNITLDQARFAAELIPFMVGGFWISRHAHGRIDRGWLRPSVLALSAAAGTVAILRAVL